MWGGKSYLLWVGWSSTSQGKVGEPVSQLIIINHTFDPRAARELGKNWGWRMLLFHPQRQACSTAHGITWMDAMYLMYWGGDEPRGHHWLLQDPEPQSMGLSQPDSNWFKCGIPLATQSSLVNSQGLPTPMSPWLMMETVALKLTRNPGQLPHCLLSIRKSLSWW